VLQKKKFFAPNNNKNEKKIGFGVKSSGILVSYNILI
jgi:hypothetical protein